MFSLQNVSFELISVFFLIEDQELEELENPDEQDPDKIKIHE